MFKKLIFVFLSIALTLSACGTFEISIDPTPTPAPTETPTPLPTATAQTTATATAQNDATAPKFSNVAFYRTSAKPVNCQPDYQTLFPARILQVHARWDYVNMSAGLSIRREWYSNGKLWARYDEPWNFTKYGADGSIDDIPIYDFDAGLEPGDYELRLYINEQPQFDPAKKVGFTVDKDWSLQVVSPNGRLTGIISKLQKLMIREANGTKWELASAHDITSMTWFDDSKHILYADTDETETKNCSPLGIRYTLWIIDASTNQQYQIGSTAENLHQPQLSADGKYIAALSGTGYADACGADLRLGWIELDKHFQQIGSLHLQDFAGIPTVPNNPMIIPVTRGVWKDASHFEIGLDWIICGNNAKNPGGIYSFDLENKQATRIGDLP